MSLTQRLGKRGRFANVSKRKTVDTYQGKRLIIAFSLFLSILLYFFLCSNWHIPSKLIINGNIKYGTEAVLFWDSGEGFNYMESSRLDLGKFVPFDKKEHVIKIRRVGKKNPISSSSQVWVKAIRTDDKWIDLKKLSKQKNVALDRNGHLFFEEDGAQVVFKTDLKEKIELFFLQNPWSGYIEIAIDNDIRRYDLYLFKRRDKVVSINAKKFIPGDFSISAKLPQYNIRKLKIESLEKDHKFKLYSLEIKSKNGNIYIRAGEDKFISSIYFSDIKRITKKYYHPVRFCFQVIFAGLCTYIIFQIFGFIKKCGGIKNTFIGAKRYIFWLMFLGAVLSFSIWLIAYWPGYMTSDSIHIWWAAKKPGYFIHSHPFMNIIYYRFLQQIWDNIAIVGIFQILLTSLLGSYIFYYIYKNGVSIFLILPFYFAFALSIPVGLYNISLWKDIPFAILVVFWAFYLMKMYLEKKRDLLSISYQKTILLLLSLIALCLFRYNGIVYIIIIPIVLAVLKIISIKKVLAIFTVLVLIGITNFGIMKLYGKTDFFFHRADIFIKRLKSESISKIALRMVKQYPTVLDINTYKRYHIWYDIWYRNDDFIKWHYDFTKKSGYNEFVRYQEVKPKSEKLYAILDRVIHESYKEPMVYFSWNPYYMLYIIPVFFLYRYFPLTAVYGSVIFSQVFVLLLILGPYNYNWRYYYFLLFSLYFLIPIVALDIKTKRFRLPSSQRQREKDVSQRSLCLYRSGR